jgi:hypothetical protein
MMTIFLASTYTYKVMVDVDYGHIDGSFASRKIIHFNKDSRYDSTGATQYKLSGQLNYDGGTANKTRN